MARDCVAKRRGLNVAVKMEEMLLLARWEGRRLAV